MGSGRLWMALLGLIASLAISVVLYYFFNTPFVFLFIPFVPFLFRNSAPPDKQTCPTCGYSTRNPAYTHCPQDGHRLE